MAIRHPVPPGTVLLCDYSTGFREPEMVKRRLALVVSPRLPRRDGLCTVVPLSESAPHHPVLYQIQVTLSGDVPNFEGLVKWAKADMLGDGRLRAPRPPADGARPPRGAAAVSEGQHFGR